jgi:hypothetical protein
MAGSASAATTTTLHPEPAGHATHPLVFHASQFRRLQA